MYRKLGPFGIQVQQGGGAQGAVQQSRAQHVARLRLQNLAQMGQAPAVNPSALRVNEILGLKQQKIQGNWRPGEDSNL